MAKKNTPPGQKPRSAQAMRREIEKRKAWQYRLAGSTYDDIAEYMQISKTTAWRYIDEMYREVRERFKVEEDDRFLMELAVLEKLQEQAMPTAYDRTHKDQLKAIRLVKELRESGRRLLGTDKPAKLEIEQKGEPPTLIIGVSDEDI